MPCGCDKAIVYDLKRELHRLFGVRPEVQQLFCDDVELSDDYKCLSFYIRHQGNVVKLKLTERGEIVPERDSAEGQFVKRISENEMTEAQIRFMAENDGVDIPMFVLLKKPRNPFNFFWLEHGRNSKMFIWDNETTGAIRVSNMMIENPSMPAFQCLSESSGGLDMWWAIYGESENDITQKARSFLSNEVLYLHTMQQSCFAWDVIPLSANATSVSIEIDGRALRDEYFRMVSILPRHLNVYLRLAIIPEWDVLASAFFNRVAVMGNCQRLVVVVEGADDNNDSGNQPGDVGFLVSLENAIRLNKELEYIDLCCALWDNTHSGLQNVLKSLGEHNRAVTLRIEEYDCSRDPDYAWMKNLFETNIDVSVVDDEFKEICEKLHFTKRSHSLLSSSSEVRLFLLAKAITGSNFSNSLWQISLLLHHNVDLLICYCD